MKNAMRPIHPGGMPRQELAEFCLSASGLAGALRVAPKRITGIIKEGWGITADTAVRLERYFGTTALFRMNL